jgi:hypothetical protein
MEAKMGWEFLDPNRMGPRDGRRLLTDSELYPPAREKEYIEHGGGSLRKWGEETVFDEEMLVDQIIDIGLIAMRAMDLEGGIYYGELNRRREELIRRVKFGWLDPDGEWVAPSPGLKEWVFDYRLNRMDYRKVKSVRAQDARRLRLSAIPYFRETQVSEQGLNWERDGVDPLYMDVYTNGMYEVFRKRRVVSEGEMTYKERIEAQVKGGGTGAEGGPSWKKSVRYTSVWKGFLHRPQVGDVGEKFVRRGKGEIALWWNGRAVFTRVMGLEAIGILLGLVFPGQMRFIASRSANVRMVGRTVKEEDGSLGMEGVQVSKFAGNREEVKVGLWDGELKLSTERARDLRKGVSLWEGSGKVSIVPYEVKLGDFGFV